VSRAPWSPLVAATLVAATASACRNVGEYVWVDNLAVQPKEERSDEIAPGDLLAIQVWKQEGMSTKTRVRADGNVTFPMLDDVRAAGLTPARLASDMEGALKRFIVAPEVTVTIEERQPMQIAVAGEVVKPGVYPIDNGAGVLAALAAAGGLTPAGHDDGVFVLRPRTVTGGAPPLRIRFRYRDLVQGRGRAAEFQLRRADVVVVE
jgi:polysaccharide export outer membrane protein